MERNDWYIRDLTIFGFVCSVLYIVFVLLYFFFLLSSCLSLFDLRINAQTGMVVYAEELLLL
jgi:hypothetical protein